MRLVVFDVDGTLIESFWRGAGNPPKGSDEAREVYDRVALLPGRLETVRGLAAEGVNFALATNQAGASLGFQTIRQVHEKIGRVCAALEHFGGRPLSVHVALGHKDAPPPYDEVGHLWRRKPNPGMLADAVAAHGAELEETTFVGDMEMDRGAVEGLPGVRFRWSEDFFCDPGSHRGWEG